MRCLEGLPPAGTFDTATAVTVGVFDGIHLGHRGLLETTVRRAAEIRGHAVALTFTDHPDALLRGSAPVPLQVLDDRLRGIEQAGFDAVVLVRFTPELRDLGAADFARDVLEGRLGCRKLVLGFDSAICRRREGTAPRFRALGIDTERIPRIEVGGIAVSSSAIRDALARGNVTGAARMLGRPHALRSTVVRGDARGRRLGFPTANLAPPGLFVPAPGVYACRARFHDHDHPAVANIGVRPTFEPTGPSRIEVHVLDYDGDLLGDDLEVAFVDRLRDEQRFASATDLHNAIARDIATARDLLQAAAPDA